MGRGGVGLGLKVDVNEKIEVFGKIHKKNSGGGRVGGQVGGRVGGGIRMDVNAMLGVGVMWGIGDMNQE